METELDGPALRELVENLKVQLAHAQRLSALGELTSTLTHEFNNILTTTINYAKMGLRHKDDATREKSFQKILAAGQQAAKLCGSVLSLSRQKTDARESTDLASLVEDGLLLLERDLSKYKVAVRRDFQPVPPALVNGHQIQQVLMNLIVNARQAMPAGGVLLLSLRFDPKGPWVDLGVRDTGSGIAPENLPKIFDSFFTTKNGPDASGKGGTGLGLAACRDIIESHQGRIRVESSLGKGTSFTLRLPPASAPAVNLPVSSSTPARQSA